ESTATTQTVQVVPDTTGCTVKPNQAGISIFFTGSQSGCSRGNPTCTKTEIVNFDAAANFVYQFQSCDKFEWNFDDGTPLVTTKAAPHQFAGTKGVYHVTLRVYNEAGDGNVFYDMNFGIPQDPAPVLGFETAPATAPVNTVVTFKANSNLATTSGWKWSFDGSAPETTANGSSSTITHKFTSAGAHLVQVSAKNGTSNETILTHTIGISAVPQVKYLLPVVTHAKGAGNSVWRTDLQIFRNSGGAAVPLNFKVDFISNKQSYTPKTLAVTQSTYIHQDFVSYFTGADDSGSMVLTLDSNVLPQIWTRIYNVSEAGTFGQYIPALLISDGTSASGITSHLSDGPTNFFLPGLRVPSPTASRFRTNVGFVNVTPAAITLTVKAYDDRGLLLTTFNRTVFPFQLDQFNIASQLPSAPANAFSLQIESPTGSGLLAYASILDNISNDPAYISAIPEDDVKHADFRNIIVPGVGHLPSGWRTDVSIFNPNSSTMSFNLTYINQAGQTVSSATNVPLSGKGTLQIDDLLKQGTLQPIPADGFGMLRVDTVASEGFPTVASRTYFDKGLDGS
ncbi:MAG TPA: PKD domain-containing protein, partial [Thermoanaerobaculia bacterium]|nr:PKD domain-containing protein [Thermoanaerobaculia bacterium]